jgi:CDP-diacylglycerol--serine O-phosphatidyltransferase
VKVNLRKSLFILPNLFTLSSVFCGFWAVILCGRDATQDELYRAALLILFAMVFDTIDGRVARLTKTQSAVGVQLDSLADVMSFGLAPALLVYRWALSDLEWVGIFGSFVYVACGTIRLARFNVLATGSSGAPKAPSKYILGLPIPAAAGILISLVVANQHSLDGRIQGSSTLMLIVMGFLAFFMVSTVRFRSFKDLRLSKRLVALLIVALASTIYIAWIYHVSFALMWLLASYIFIAVIESLMRLGKKAQTYSAK